jgi:hypothetical protein
MRRITKFSAAQLLGCRAAPGRVAVRRAAPAWFEAERGLEFAALATPAVSSRVRVGLVLRAVPAPQAKPLRRSHHVRGVR